MNTGLHKHFFQLRAEMSHAPHDYTPVSSKFCFNVTIIP
jgi:hypothetical protein